LLPPLGALFLDPLWFVDSGGILTRAAVARTI
jgi:hypothetical protein